MYQAPLNDTTIFFLYLSIGLILIGIMGIYLSIRKILGEL